MKNIKLSVVALFGAAILSLGLYACSNDDATTTSNTTEQTMAEKPFADLKIIPSLPGFGLVSSYAGPCVSAPGFCIERVTPGTGPVFGIGKLDNNMLRLTMSMETYQTNKEYLSGDIYEVGVDFALNEEISKELGFDIEVIIPKQKVNVVQENSDMFYIDLSIKHNYDAEVIMNDFMLYKAVVEFPRVTSLNENEKLTAKSFALISYSDLINPTYIYDGDEYNDLGLGNDIEAGDGIYTSNSLYEVEETNFDYQKLNINVSSKFTALNLLKEEFENKTLSERKPKPKRGGGWRGAIIGGAIDYLLGCDFKTTTEGKSLLGFSCESGCIEIDC
ncbi:hypothetical protein [Paenimyroides aestuarii]|uniref:Uncharacterized protein n=1 Tax=Paenimyroides aestuarii TaxID=2968490 RepID=A0ABY5NUY8_9FLAO|nr:hypothetical protein [Paenimyroides aestuarii]UUV22411.1 hypothetical protein NPX36_05065 [Paenimyroides aestuarii]